MKGKIKFIINPNNDHKTRWDYYIMVAAIFNCFTIPFKVAYSPPVMDGVVFIVLNAIIDFTFFVDILVTFRTCYIDDFGNEVFLPSEIAKNYVSG